MTRPIAGLAEVQASWEVGTSALARALGTTGPPIVVEISGRSLEDLRLAADEVEALVRSAADHCALMDAQGFDYYLVTLDANGAEK